METGIRPEVGDRDFFCRDAPVLDQFALGKVGDGCEVMRAAGTPADEVGVNPPFMRFESLREADKGEVMDRQQCRAGWAPPSDPIDTMIKIRPKCAEVARDGEKVPADEIAERNFKPVEAGMPASGMRSGCEDRELEFAITDPPVVALSSQAVEQATDVGLVSGLPTSETNAIDDNMQRLHGASRLLGSDGVQSLLQMCRVRG